MTGEGKAQREGEKGKAEDERRGMGARKKGMERTGTAIPGALEFPGSLEVGLSREFPGQKGASRKSASERQQQRRVGQHGFRVVSVTFGRDPHDGQRIITARPAKAPASQLVSSRGPPQPQNNKYVTSSEQGRSEQKEVAKRTWRTKAQGGNGRLERIEGTTE